MVRETVSGFWNEQRLRISKTVLVFAALCFTAYLPALDNGFISDDFVFLERVDEWKNSFTYLFTIPPENFRMTTYGAFRILKAAFGYNPEPFYAFTIFVHFINSILLWRLLAAMTDEEIGFGSAIFFAVIQNPQEAVMWLGGMHEVLLGFAILAGLSFWLKERFFVSTLFYCLALFSKESGLLFVPLVLLVDFARARKVRLRSEYLYLILPTLLFLVLFVYTAPRNSLVVNGFYAPGLEALRVLVKSVHKLAFPWFYLLLIFVVATRGRFQLFWNSIGFVWMITALAPYIFLTYQQFVPSRHFYLASMGFVLILMNLVRVLPSLKLRRAFVSLFIAVNIGYIWLVKDPQFENRAAPTRRLVAELRKHSPGQTLILDFPENPWTAKLATRLIPGWQPDMLVVNEALAECPNCPILVWDRKNKQYRAVSKD